MSKAYFQWEMTMPNEDCATLMPIKY